MNEKEILQSLKVTLDWIKGNSESLHKAQENKINGLINFIKLYAESFLHVSDPKRKKWLIGQFILDAQALNPDLKIDSRYSMENK